MAIESLVDPRTAASTASPSRSRVAERSLISRERFNQPSRDRTTVASSSRMNASASNSTSSPPAPPMRVRRLSLNLSDSSESSVRITFHNLRLSPRMVRISLARICLSRSSSRMAWISRRASLYSFSSRMASVWTSSIPNRFISFEAASALPSDLRMMRIASSSRSKMMRKPSRM